MNLNIDILNLVTFQTQKFSLKVMGVSLSLNGYRYNSTETETGLTVQSGDVSRGVSRATPPRLGRPGLN